MHHPEFAGRDQVPCQGSLELAVNPLEATGPPSVITTNEQLGLPAQGRSIHGGRYHSEAEAQKAEVDLYNELYPESKPAVTSADNLSEPVCLSARPAPAMTAAAARRDAGAEPRTLLSTAGAHTDLAMRC